MFPAPRLARRLLGPFIDAVVSSANGCGEACDFQLVSIDGHDPLLILAIKVRERTPLYVQIHCLLLFARHCVCTDNGVRPLDNRLVLLGCSFHAVVGNEFRETCPHQDALVAALRSQKQGASWIWTELLGLLAVLLVVH